MDHKPMDHTDDAMRAVMAEMGRRGAKSRWADADEATRKAHGAMLAKARKRAKRNKTKALKNS